MNRLRTSFVAIMLLLFATVGHATIDAYTFSSPAQEQRFRSLIQELRCPRCQNESLAGSDAPVARDLKDRVYLMVQEGKSNDQIKKFLVARYGVFVIYRPPMQGHTLWLWVGPWLLAAVVLWAVIVRLRERSRQQAVPLSAEEQERLRQLLHEEKSAP